MENLAEENSAGPSKGMVSIEAQEDKSNGDNIQIFENPNHILPIVSASNAGVVNCSNNLDATSTTVVLSEAGDNSEASNLPSGNIQLPISETSTQCEDNQNKQNLPVSAPTSSENADSGLEEEESEENVNSANKDAAKKEPETFAECTSNKPSQLDCIAEGSIAAASVDNVTSTTNQPDVCDTAETAKALAEATATVESSSSSSRSSPLTSITSGIPSASTAWSVYHVKWVGASQIEKNHSQENAVSLKDSSGSSQVSKIAVVTQNENGPCPLLSIVNVLLLQRKLTLPEGCEVISAEQLLEYLG